MFSSNITSHGMITVNFLSAFANHVFQTSFWSDPAVCFSLQTLGVVQSCTAIPTARKSLNETMDLWSSTLEAEGGEGGRLV